MSSHLFDSFYVDRLRSGDFTIQQHFVAYFSELIRLKVGKRMRSTAAIEDVRQETFTRVLRLVSDQRIRQPERLGAIVNSVCNNVLHEHHRSRSRENSAGEEGVNAIPDSTIGAYEAMARRQLQQAVRQILDELREKDRCLLKALFVEERSKDEVCRDLAVTREYLRVLIHRAKVSFRSHYLRIIRQASKCESHMKRRILENDLRTISLGADRFGFGGPTSDGHQRRSVRGVQQGMREQQAR
jgi:RNA polymerase sigma-70 factor (ECF subfamily)